MSSGLAPGFVQCSETSAPKVTPQALVASRHPPPWTHLAPGQAQPGNCSSPPRLAEHRHLGDSGERQVPAPRPLGTPRPCSGPRVPLSAPERASLGHGEQLRERRAEDDDQMGCRPLRGSQSGVRATPLLESVRFLEQYACSKN